MVERFPMLRSIEVLHLAIAIQMHDRRTSLLLVVIESFLGQENVVHCPRQVMEYEMESNRNGRFRGMVHHFGCNRLPLPQGTDRYRCGFWLHNRKLRPWTNRNHHVSIGEHSKLLHLPPMPSLLLLDKDRMPKSVMLQANPLGQGDA